MRLVELNPKFMKYGKEIADKGHGRTLPDGSTQWGGFEVDVLGEVNTVAEADLISFLCPKCFLANKGSKGTHSVFVWFKDRPGIPPGTNNNVRWTVAGNSFENLTTTPSVLCTSGCKWHGFITNGEVSII